MWLMFTTKERWALQKTRRIEQFQQFFDRPALGMAFQGGCHHGDDALLDGGETNILLVDQEQPVVSLQNNLSAAGTHSGLLLFDQPE